METIVGMGWAGLGYPVCLLIRIFIGRYIWPKAQKTLTGMDILKKDLRR